MYHTEKPIISGYVSIKEGGLRSFLWTKRWMQLRDQMLTIHKNEVLKFVTEANISGYADCSIKRSYRCL